MKKTIITSLLMLTVATSLVGCTTTYEFKNTRVNNSTEASKNIKGSDTITRGGMNEIKQWEINFQYYPHDELPDVIIPKNTHK